MNKVKRQIRDKDLANEEVALRRAAKRARIVAEQTHTPLVVYEVRTCSQEIPLERKKQTSKLMALAISIKCPMGRNKYHDRKNS